MIKPCLAFLNVLMSSRSWFDRCERAVMLLLRLPEKYVIIKTVVNLRSDRPDDTKKMRPTMLIAMLKQE